MFENEAKERAEKLEETQTLGVYDNDEDLARAEGFNDGEVYGCEIGFIDGAEFGYNKANEWYYPSKGEYPRKEALYLCYWQDGEITADKIYIDGNGEPYFAGSVTFADIIAWKEIVLPKESE